MNKNEEFKLIYTEHVSELIKFCTFRLKQVPEAEDVVSESFIKLYEANNFSEIENKRAYLYKVCSNIMNDKYKANKNFVDIDNEIAESIVNTDRKSLEEIVVDSETASIVEKYLDKIDPISSEIIVLRIWEDFRFTEIADIVQMNVDAVRKRFERGITDLKNAISRDEKKLNFKAVSVPFIMAGILGITNTPTYAAVGTSVATVSAALSTTLNINLLTMATPLIGAGAAASATTAAASTGAAPASGMFAIATAKIIAAAAITIAGTGVGLGVISVVNQPEPYVPETVQTIPFEDETSTMENDEDMVEKTTKLFSYPEYGFSFELPIQDTYEPIKYELGISGSYENDPFRFSLQENLNNFDDGKITYINYSPNGYILFPCGIGCGGESFISINFLEGQDIDSRIEQIKIDWADASSYSGDLGLVENELITLFGLQGRKIRVQAPADSPPATYLFNVDGGLLSIDTFINGSEETQAVFESIKIISGKNYTSDSDNVNSLLKSYSAVREASSVQPYSLEINFNSSKNLTKEYLNEQMKSNEDTLFGEFVTFYYDSGEVVLTQPYEGFPATFEEIISIGKNNEGYDIYRVFSNNEYRYITADSIGYTLEDCNGLSQLTPPCGNEIYWSKNASTYIQLICRPNNNDFRVCNEIALSLSMKSI